MCYATLAASIQGLPWNNVMKENVLDVLTYMFESYFYEEADTMFNRDTLLEELIDVGFEHHNVEKSI